MLPVHPSSPYKQTERLGACAFWQSADRLVWSADIKRFMSGSPVSAGHHGASTNSVAAWSDQPGSCARHHPGLDGDGAHMRGIWLWLMGKKLSVKSRRWAYTTISTSSKLDSNLISRFLMRFSRTQHFLLLSRLKLVPTRPTTPSSSSTSRTRAILRGGAFLIAPLSCG